MTVSLQADISISLGLGVEEILDDIGLVSRPDDALLFPALGSNQRIGFIDLLNVVGPALC